MGNLSTNGAIMGPSANSLFYVVSRKALFDPTEHEVHSNYKVPVVPQHCVSISKTHHFVCLRGMISVFCDRNSAHINTLSIQSAESLNINTRGRHNYHFTLKVNFLLVIRSCNEGIYIICLPSNTYQRIISAV